MIGVDIEEGTLVKVAVEGDDSSCSFGGVAICCADDTTYYAKHGLIGRVVEVSDPVKLQLADGSVIYVHLKFLRNCSPLEELASIAE